MVGVIHQLLFGFVEKNFGAAAVADVKRQAGLAEDRQFRMDAAYSDEEWQKLLGAAVQLAAKPAQEVELAFARYAGEELTRRMAGFFQGCSGTLEFIKRQPNIHNMMSSSVRDAKARQQITDKFRVESGDGETITHYASPNRHCTLYRGLALAVADHYRERIEITEPRCMKRGDPACEIHVRCVGKQS
jgi:hypothetical protein